MVSPECIIIGAGIEYLYSRLIKILPEKLMVRYVEKANFYSNSASSCEQYALAHFIEKGYFERHLSRMRKYYQRKGDLLMGIIRQSPLLPVVDIRGGIVIWMRERYRKQSGD